MSVSSLTSALADRYRIERELGAGGMATVYLAQDIKHDRKVAVKILKPELAAVIGGARFLAEIRTTANLQHPHILPLHDSGEVNGTVYYVMPFVDGETLRDRLNREKQLPIEDALRIATEVAGALHYAHGHGVIHRDIKPENILLHGGHALVADFGIALAASASSGGRMTETGMSLGTPHYMSPEQAMGERDITARSDVYALGCVLYEMLLGEPPFTGPTAQSIVAKVLSERPAPMRARRERVTPAIEAATFRALEKLPADRFGTLAEFAAALATPGALTQDIAISTYSVSTQRGWRPDRRFVFIGGLVMGLLSAAVWLNQQVAPTVTATTSTQLTFNGRSHSPAISPDGEFVAFVESRCPIGDEAGCAQSLYVQERGNARPVEVLSNVRDLTAPRWTADGLSLVVEAQLDSLRNGLFVVPRLGGVARTLGAAGVFDTHATADSVMVVRPDGKSGQQVAHVYSIASGARADSILLGKRAIDAIGWSPDGKLIALVQEYAQASIARRDGTIADSVISPLRGTVRWTPDGRSILAFRALPVKEDDLDRMAVDASGRIGERVVLMQRVSALLLGQFDVARRTGRIAFVAGSLNIDLWTFELPPLPPGAHQRTSGTTWYSEPSISPDGKQVYYLRGDAFGDNLYQLTLPSSEEALRVGHLPGGTNDVRVSRANRRVIFGSMDSAGVVLGEFDMASRRTRSFAFAASADTDAPRPFGERGLAYIGESSRSIDFVDSAGAQKRSLMAPDSLAILGFDFSNDEKEVVVLVQHQSGGELAITPVSSWSPRSVIRPIGSGYAANIDWASDGWIYIASTRTATRTSTLWRIREGQQQFNRVTELPATCLTRTARVAFAAPRGVCVTRDARGDVWLADLPGMAR